MFEEDDKDKRYNHAPKAIVADSLKKKLGPIRKYREDRYWFIGPDEKEYVVEVLSRFCKQFKLNRSRLYAVIKKEIDSYRGWKLSPLTNNTVINTVTSEEVKVLLPSNFARNHNLDISHLNKLLRGERKSCDDWVVKDRIFIQKPAKGKIYMLTSPSGETIKFNNLSEFARENELDMKRLYELITNGRKKKNRWTYHGWTAYGMTPEIIAQKKFERYDKRAKDYVFFDPEGNKVLVHNITLFCKEHNLTKQDMIALAKGKAKSHKGWTTVNPE